MNYENYASINNSVDATQKNWCISLAKKPVKQVSASLSNGKKFPYVSRFAIELGNVIVVGKEYAYELSALHDEAETTGLFGIVSDVSDKITVKKSELKSPTVQLFGHNDHRIVMALAVLLSITGGKIKGAEAVAKSYPDFWDNIRALGIEAETVNEIN